MLMTVVQYLLVIINLVTSQKFLDLKKEDSICPLNETFVNMNISRTYYIAELQPGDNQAPRDCTILMKTMEKDWGLMVYIETMYLRGNEEDGCVDFIQFGEDDMVPFVTLRRSDKICGEVNKWSFDVGNGALNIWMHFDVDRPKYFREKLAVVNLRMVITPYRKKSVYGFSECHQSGHFLPNSFFCDTIVNCATDLVPRDESDLLCKTTTTSTTSTVAPTFPTIQTTYINIGFESEDLRLGTITSVSLAVLVGLGCCMVCCVKRCSRMSLPPTPTSDPDECHEMRLSGLPVGGHSSHHQRIIHRGGEGSANRYIEGAIGSDMLGGRDHNTGIIDIEGGEGGELPPRGNTPPPAYSEIFPEGYQHSLAKQTNKEDDHVESTDV